MEIQFKHLVIPIILVIALVAGVFFYQKQNSNNKKTTIDNSNYNPNDTGGIILGDQNVSSADNSSRITDGNIYATKINSIRSPIIKDVNELNSRMKYKTVFDNSAIISFINEVIAKNQAGIDQIRNLNLDPKFSTANQKNIQSLEKISESLTALKKSYQIEDKTEAQKQRELYAYNLEQSDSVYKGIQIPK